MTLHAPGTAQLRDHPVPGPVWSVASDPTDTDTVTVICAGCGAAWRLLSSMSDDDQELLLEQHARHACPPEAGRRHPRAATGGT